MNILDKINISQSDSGYIQRRPLSVRDRNFYIGSQTYDYLPGFIRSLFMPHGLQKSGMSASIDFLTADNQVVVEIKPTNPFTDLTKEEFETNVLQYIDLSDAATKDVLAASKMTTFVDDGKRYFSFEMPDRFEMTKDKMKEWLGVKIAGFVSSPKVSFLIDGDVKTGRQEPVVPALSVDGIRNTLKVYGTGGNFAIISVGGEAIDSIAVEAGSGIVIESPKASSGYRTTFEEAILGMNSDIAQKLARVNMMAVGYGDVEIGFDPLNTDDIIKKISGADNKSSLTADIISSLSEEKKYDLMQAVLGKVEYAVPTLHIRSNISYLSAVNDGEDTNVRTLTIQRDDAAIIDMWTEACIKAVKAAGMSNHFGIGVCQGEKNPVSWEYSGGAEKPVFFIDTAQAAGWNSQKMLTEAVRAVSGIAEHIHKVRGQEFDKTDYVLNVFSNISEANGYSDIRRTLRKNMEYGSLLLPVKQDNTFEGMELATSLASWVWPGIEHLASPAIDIAPEALTLPQIAEVEPQQPSIEEGPVFPDVLPAETNIVAPEPVEEIKVNESENSIDIHAVEGSSESFEDFFSPETLPNVEQTRSDDQPGSVIDAIEGSNEDFGSLFMDGDFDAEPHHNQHHNGHKFDR